MIEMKLDLLPEECIAHVLSCTSPREACQSSAVSSTVRDAAESDLLWDKFLPSDYQEIVSRLMCPVTFTTKKELFLKLSSPLLIDGGSKMFSIDKLKNKKCYILSARELSITWATNPLYWCWKPLLQSRFPEIVELIMVCWLEIHGKMNTRMLSPNTVYGAYLIFKIANRAYGLESCPSEVSVEVGDYRSQGTTYLRPNSCGKQSPVALKTRVSERGEPISWERADGWLETELGDFYNDGSEKEVKMSLKEVKNGHLKGGLLVEGIELRPKQ